MLNCGCFESFLFFKFCKIWLINQLENTAAMLLTTQITYH
jgi:hypothetical protein